MAQNVARLGVIFGMDSAEFESGLKKIGRGFDDVVTKVKYASAGVAVAFTAMTAKALQFSDQISDVAQANEVAVKTVMALSEGLAQNGGSAENAGKLISSFTAKIDDAAQGSKEAQETFARVGISLKDLASKDVTALFDQAVMSLGRMDDAVSRNAVAMSIFGKAAKGVDFVGLSEGTAEARLEFEEYAKAVKLAGELHDKLDAKANKTIVMFTNAFIPTLNAVFDELNKTGGAMEAFFNFSGEFFKTLVAGVAGFVAYIKILGQALGEINQLFVDFEKGKGFNPKERWMNLENYANIELGKAQEFANRIYFPEAYAIKPKEPVKPAGREVKPYVDKEEVNKAKKIAEGLAMAEQLSIEYRRQLEFQYGILEAQGRMNFMSEKERQIAEAVAKVTDETSKKLTEIQNKKEEALAHGVDQKVIDAMEAQKQKIIELGYAYEELTRKQIETQINAQNTFMFGWDKAFKQHYEDAQNYSTLGAKAFESVTNSMSSAIDNFVENGKASFKDFTMSIIKDLVKIQLKMQAMQLFKMGMGALGTSFGGGSGMADMFAAGGGTNFGAVAAGGAMASGGPVEGNTSYLVGEQGPELFMPSRSGSIIPNNKLSDMGGGQTVNYNGPYIASMSAIDTQSATQFLSQNKQTIWAVNQSASRSMPTSR